MSETVEAPQNAGSVVKEIPERSFTCAVPQELAPFRPAINAAIFYLSLGREPRDFSQWEDIPYSACRNTRMVVCGRSVRLLERLATRFGSERQAVIRALAWVAEQPTDQFDFLCATTIN